MIRDPTITLVSSFNTQFYNLNDFILDQKAPNLKKKKKKPKSKQKKTKQIKQRKPQAFIHIIIKI